MEPVLTSEDSSVFLRRKSGHMVLLFSLVGLVYLIVSPAENNMFRKGFLVQTGFKTTQNPFREPDPGPVSLTDAEELNALFVTAALPVEPIILAPVEGTPIEVIRLDSKAEIKKISKIKGGPLKKKVVAKIIKPDPLEDKVLVVPTKDDSQDVSIAPSNQKISLLTLIRNDPNRIYIDQEFIVGDLTWLFRNATDSGIEILVTNRNESLRTYYFPKVIVDGSESVMEGRVLAPGQKVFGVIPYSDLRKKDELRITLKTVGMADKKVKVNLIW